MAQTTISARIPRQLNAALEAVTEDKGAFRSEVIQRALRYYVAQNPDGITVFEQDHGKTPAQDGLEQSRSNGRAWLPIDPSEEL